jgi:hypothetical protein
VIAGASSAALEKAEVGVLCEGNVKMQVELGAQQNLHVHELPKRRLQVQASANETALQFAKLLTTAVVFPLIPSLATDLRKEDSGLLVEQSIAKAKQVLEKRRLDNRSAVW